MAPSPVSFKNFGVGSPSAPLQDPAISPEGTAEPAQLSTAGKPLPPDSDFLLLDTGYHFPEILDVA